MSPTPAPRRRRGFTLVELLVVIGIIAVLIGILLPSLNKARESANAVACSSNMRQVGLGILMYANENRGKYPFAGGTDYATFYVSWDELIHPYMGVKPTWNTAADPQPLDVKALRCPNDEVQREAWAGTHPNSYAMASYWPGNNFGPQLTSYAVSSFAQFDANWAPNPGWCGGFRSVKTSEARAAAATLLLVERHASQNAQGSSWGAAAVSPRCADGSWPAQINESGPELTAKTPAHGGKKKWNYLFADGHAEPLEPGQTVGTTAPPSWRATTTWNWSGPGTPPSEYGPLGMWTINPND